MGSLTINVPDDREAEFHTMLGAWLASDDPSDEAGDGIEWVMEARITKRPWVGESAGQDAKKMLGSIDQKIHPLVSVFLEAPEQRRTIDELAELTGWAPPTINSYRGLFGKQAYRTGKYLNPITSEKSGDQVQFYMQPEAATALKAAGL